MNLFIEFGRVPGELCVPVCAEAGAEQEQAADSVD